MSDQGTEEKDLGAQDATLSAGDKPADTRIAPGVTEQNHTESEAGDASAAQPKKRQLTLRTIGAIAACAVALVAVFAGIGYATGLFGSAQPDERVTQQQAQEQPASASSTSVKQSTSGQPDNSQDGGDKASSAEDGKAKDENSSTDSSQEQSEGSSSEQASQSDASSGGSGASGSAASNATENSDPASSSGSAPAYQEPEPEPALAPAPSTISVYISIDSSRAKLWPGRLLLWLHGVRRPVRDRCFRFRLILLCKRHQRSRREAMRQRKWLDICRERVVPGEGLRALHAFR